MGLPKSAVQDDLPSEIQKQLEFLSKAGPFGMLGSLSHEKQMRDIIDQVTRLEAANRHAFGYLLDASRLDTLGTKTLGENISRIVEQQAFASRAAYAGIEESLRPILKAQEHFQRSFGQLALNMASAQSAWQETVRQWESIPRALAFPDVLSGIKAAEVEVNRLAHLCRVSAGFENRIVRASLRNLEVLNNLQSARLREISNLGRTLPSLGDLSVAADFAVKFNQFFTPAISSRPAKAIDNEVTPAETLEFGGLGPILDKELGRIDPRFVKLRRSARKIMTEHGSAGLLLASHGIRELFDQVLRALVSDDEIKASGLWLNREDLTLNKPTRRMRIEFLVGPHREKLETVLTFGSSLKKVQGFAHSFPEDEKRVNAYLSELENYIYLMLVYSSRR